MKQNVAPASIVSAARQLVGQALEAIQRFLADMVLHALCIAKGRFFIQAERHQKPKQDLMAPAGFFRQCLAGFRQKHRSIGTRIHPALGFQSLDRLSCGGLAYTQMLGDISQTRLAMGLDQIVDQLHIIFGKLGLMGFAHAPKSRRATGWISKEFRHAGSFYEPPACEPDDIATLPRSALMAIRCRLRWIAVIAGAGACTLASTASLADERPKVATTFTVIADIARNVAGDAIEIVSITKPGAEIHGYQPTPQDLVRVADADMVFWNGMNLEIWFEQFHDGLEGAFAITVSDGVAPIPITSGTYSGQPNPHAWMSPTAAATYVDNITVALTMYDAENAALYQQNAARYKAEIAAAVEPLRETLARIPEDRRWLVTCEGAFSYLAQDFGLRELYIWPMNADEAGTPQQVRRVIDGVREHDIPAVFCESTVSDAPARQVARETGAAFGGVLYVDSLSGPDGPVPTYLDLLRVTTTTIADALAPSEP